MSKAVYKTLLFFVFLISHQINIAKAEYESIGIPCTVKECNPKWGDTLSRWYKGDSAKPTLMWFSGGAGTFADLNYREISLLKGKFNIIMVPSPLPIITNKSTDGFPKNAYNKYCVFRMKQVAEYYKKKFNKPIWLGGISSAGPIMVGILIGNEKNRPSDIFAGAIFASPYLARIKKINDRPTGEFTYNIRVSQIKYKMNLPILVVNHARDHKPAQHPKKQEWFTKQLAKRNSNITELKLLTEGDPKITYHDGGHHWFQYNKEELARVVSKFVLDNTK